MITIKIGGSVVDGLHSTFVSELSQLHKNGIIIVHGGGKEVSHVCSQMGIEPKFVTSPSGIRSRYTDAETMSVFEMVMAGRINQNIVRMLQKNGISAVGLAGADARIIEATRKKRLLITNEKGRPQAIDGGYTGKITSVNHTFLDKIIQEGMVPVISPVAISEEFESLNVDGDRAAANVAGATGSDSVVFITDVDGLYMNDKLVQSLALQEARDIRTSVGPGMEKKILASTEALQMGVGRAIIACGQRNNPITRALSHDECTVISDG
ncbi:MAG: [LysW]-aminoadipate/[LysW]-glutamate kinase [Cenarchaeum sp. SB0665_bin_23]|nr:[LysW]-aminoadipate/[LysW]-glutamate kinase [Cenarchaeum sp. SB0667_bin_13]MXY38129.1 [LysW]-aminoadipate/[LysW]-glutamate kinase [Cenarchaeum sp. SB0664_bin_35]MXY61537.1 [LysW]-aminoadipate/[LysW]-glutamate kinase [Cenarchaeum sp. SB0665_bin_23]MXZ94201.1 [LysW]-aminoadipate/[LysW]-glutamate kinase [Cenarchaeum sp. SB0666_bin_15]MYB46794.1 [LysW]-aminoadipate/[LysW]-glutamate kinase [Cenarchaeum sp. SB0662_bin_33]MYC80415.1 [LysW]-aminoadipate/[LysW]-glutamate kinase [Cenarchaeum sp. SB06